MTDEANWCDENKAAVDRSNSLVEAWVEVQFLLALDLEIGPVRFIKAKDGLVIGMPPGLTLNSDRRPIVVVYMAGTKVLIHRVSDSPFGVRSFR